MNYEKPYILEEESLPIDITTIREKALALAQAGQKLIVVRRNADPREHVFAFDGTNTKAYENLRPGDQLEFRIKPEIGPEPMRQIYQ